MVDVAWASTSGCVGHETLGPILGIQEIPFVPMPAVPFAAAERFPAIDCHAIAGGSYFV